MAGRKKTTATTKKRSPLAGRNRYPQKCGCCGELVPAYAGFLKKRPKGFTGYEVFHDQCKQTMPETLLPNDGKPSEILALLEARLIDRQLKGLPVIDLPRVIEYIKELEAKVNGHAQ